MKKRLFKSLGVVTLVSLMSVAPCAAGGTYRITASGSALCSLGGFQANVPGFGQSCDAAGVAVNAPPQGSADGDRELFQVASPSSALSIVDAQTIGASETVSRNREYGGGTYWNGGGSDWRTITSSDSGSISSQYFGLQIVCGTSKVCGPTKGYVPTVSVTGINLTVNEATQPTLIAAGNDNLFYQSGRWVWNPPGDPWPVTLYGNDPSGVCRLDASLSSGGGTPVQVDQQNQPNTAAFVQCQNNWTSSGALNVSDTTASGAATLIVSAVDAAGNTSQASAPLSIDNVQPNVTITPDDSAPGDWAVNHAVNVQIQTEVGPSGISSVTCSDQLNGQSRPLALSSFTSGYETSVDGNGVHTVSCTVANNAVDPQGAHDAGTATQSIKIDEQPPTLSFEPVSPSDPAQVLVQTSDSESPVSGGTISIAPRGSSSFTPLATQLTSGGMLVATVPDARLRAGDYTLQASATSQVGNTGTVSEDLTLPLRASARSAVSFHAIAAPQATKRVRVRVRVGGHWVIRRRHGKRVRVRVGGHVRTVTLVEPVRHCHSRRVRVSRHRWVTHSICRAPRLLRFTQETVGFGRSATVHGLLLTTAGVPIAMADVTLLAAPANGLRRFRVVRTVHTNAAGGWTTSLPAGPSRIIRASYAGSATVLPASGEVRLIVPARIFLRVTPRRLTWSGYVHISGHLLGGYVPHDGVALRLLVRYPGSRAASPLLAFRTDARGAFSIRWTFNAGRGTLTLPFSVASDSNESDFPYAASASRAVRVTFGG